MIKKLTESEALKYKNLSAEEKSKKGILGRLYGNVASFAAPTRNGRKYTKDLWDNLFNSDLIKERFANGGIFGELCHPDYEEVDMSKIAVVMPEPPTKDDNGNLIAYLDIIDTPCGRIAYQLAKYGYKFGISSRGTGDLIEGVDGDEVDPNTYQLNAFDLVEIPAVESARLSFTESLQTKTRYNKTLKESLMGELEKASEGDRKIMKEALSELDIDLEEKVDDALRGVKPEKTGKWEVSFPKNAIQRVNDIIYSEMSEEDFNLLNDNSWEALDKDKEALAIVKPILRKYHLPMWALEVFVEDWEELDESVEEGLKYIDPNEPAGPGRIEGPGINWRWYYTDSMEDAKAWFKELTGAEAEDNLIVEPVERSNPGKFDNKYGFRIHMDEAFSPQGYTKAIEAINMGIESDEDTEDLRKYLQDIVNYCKSVADDYDILLEECNNESCSDKDHDEEEGVNDTSELVAQLQESLIANKKLAEDNISLQEKLSVCNAKEVRLEEELRRKTDAVVNLSEKAKTAKKLSSKVKELNESLANKEEVISATRSRLESFKEFRKESAKKLKESNSEKDELKSQVDNLKDQLRSINDKLNESKSTVKKYQKAYAALKESYLQSKADAYGISKESVKSNLNESYTVKDIDRVCEDLANQKRAMSKLPFRINENASLKASQSKDYSIKMKSKTTSEDDDFVSDSLLRMIK